MYYTDDPIRDAERYAEEKDKLLESLPTCETCGDAIQDTYCFRVNGELICKHCMMGYHLVWIEELTEDGV